MKKLLVILTVLIVVAAFNGCSEEGPKQSSTSKKESAVSKESKKVDPKDYDAKGRYREALKLAQEWQSDAKLYGVDVYYRIKGDKFIPLNLSYDFGSPKYPEGGYTISTFDYSEELIGTVNDALGLMELNPVEIEKWRLNNKEVVRISENSGGKEYRKTERADLFAASLFNSPNIIWSTQYYFEKDSSKGVMGIGINAETGEVIDKF